MRKEFMSNGLTFAAALAATLTALTPVSGAEKIKIGVLTDMSGFISPYTGRGSVVAAQLAAEDFAKESPGMEVEVIFADHQLKPDVASTIARRWFDEQSVDMVVDVPGSAIVLALTNLVRDKNKVLLSTVSGSPKITGSECSPNTIGWTISNWALANGVVKTAVKNGGDSWFFLTSDWEYGHTLQAEASKVVESAGGKVLGAVRHPVGATEFSSYLLQAQSSRAKVIGLANSGSETTNSIKQASEFGVAQGGQKLASLYFQITDADSLGLQNAQQLQFVTAFYWDREESGRAFAKRFMARMNGQAPADTQAGVYSSTLSYLRSASQLGSAKDGKRVVDHMRSWNWFEAPLFGKTRIRKDGTAEHVLFLAETKSPKESTGRWDYLKILSTIPAEDAFQPESETGCPLSKN